MKRICFAVAIGHCFIANLTAPGESIYVDHSVASSGDGTSWAEAFKTIREGIQAADNGDEVVVAAGTYIETVDFLGKAITVRSRDFADWGVVSATVIEAGGSPEVVRFRSLENRDAVLAGFTIAGGRVGVLCVWSSPTICNNIIEANVADFDMGGGISCYYSSALIVNNIIASNQAAGGGAGIACEGEAPLIVRNLIIGNVTDIDGGGILSLYSSPTIALNRVIANVSQGNGGGISLHGSDAEVSNNLLVSNTANSAGGAVACSFSTSRFVGNTIANNSAQGGGAGGIHFFDSSGPIVNCIVWGNGDDLSDCTASFSCIEDNDPEDQGEGNIHENPTFTDPDGADDLFGTHDDDYTLQAPSPCADTGSFSATTRLSVEKKPDAICLSWDPGTDLLGNSRISGLAPDMGCCEYQSTPPVYAIESSPDLRDWSAIHTGGDTHFIISPIPAAQKAFFRVFIPQQ